MTKFQVSGYVLGTCLMTTCYWFFVFVFLAARAIAAIENPADVFVVSSRPYGQRAVLKFARYIGATPIAGRFTPG